MPDVDADVPDAQLAYEVPGALRPSMAVTIGVVGLRLMGIHIMVTAAASVPSLIYMLSQSRGGGPGSAWASPLVFWLISPVSYGAIGWWMVARSSKLGARLFARLPEDAGDAVSARQLATLLVAAVGLLVLLYCVPQLVMAAVMLANGNFAGFGITTANTTSAAGYYASVIAMLLGHSFPIAAGLYLVLRADRVSRVASRYIED